MPDGRKCAITILGHLPRGLAGVTRVGNMQPLYNANDHGIVETEGVGEVTDVLKASDLNFQHANVNEL